MTIAIVILSILLGGGSMRYVDSARIAHAQEITATAQADASASAKQVASLQAAIQSDRDAITALERVVSRMQDNAQLAANATARGTAVFETAPAAGRKETVLANAAAEAAAVLPPPTNYAEILADVRKQLDEARTMAVILQRQHENDIAAMTAARVHADAASAELVRTQVKAEATLRTATVAEEQARIAHDAAKSAAGLLASAREKIETGWAWACLAGIAYLLVHFLLPSLAQQYPNSKVLGLLWGVSKSLTSAH